MQFTDAGKHRQDSLVAEGFVTLAGGSKPIGYFLGRAQSRTRITQADRLFFGKQECTFHFSVGSPPTRSSGRLGTYPFFVQIEGE